MSFLAFCTAWVVSPPSSSWIYSTLASPIFRGRSSPVFFCGMPIAVVGPVAETISPTRTCAIAPLMPNSSAAADIVKHLNMSSPFFALVFSARRAKMRMLCRWPLRDKPYAPASGELPGGEARRPCPLKVVAAQMPRDIDDLTDEIQARNALDCHRLRRKMPRFDAPQRHFGLVIAKRSGG